MILYCDGVFLQGNNKQAVEFQGSKLYFRGAVNMRAHLKWINEEYNFAAASKIVFAGSSAGGFGVYLWTDYLRNMVEKPEKVYSIVDGAMFLDLNDLTALEDRGRSIMQLAAPSALNLDPNNPQGADLIQQVIGSLKP